MVIELRPTDTDQKTPRIDIYAKYYNNTHLYQWVYDLQILL